MRFYQVPAYICLLSFTSAYVQQWSPSRLTTELFERKPFITGNWKLNPQTKQEAIDLATGVANAVTKNSAADVAIFVPFPFLDAVQKCVGDKIHVGAEVSECRCFFHFLLS